jgi:hypothetical protein
MEALDSLYRRRPKGCKSLFSQIQFPRSSK